MTEKAPSGDPGYDYKVETKEVLSEEVTLSQGSDSTSTNSNFIFSNEDIIDYDTISVGIDGQVYTCEQHTHEDKFGNKYIYYGSQPEINDQGEWLQAPDFLDYPFCISSLSIIGNDYSINEIYMPLQSSEEIQHTVVITTPVDTATTTIPFKTAVQSVIDEAVPSIIQNNLGYKCFYTNDEADTLIDSSITTTPEFSNITTPCATQLYPSLNIDDSFILVVFDGTEFICPKQINEYGYHYGATPSFDTWPATYDWSEYPFSIMCPNKDNMYIIYTEDAGTYSLIVQQRHKETITTSDFERAVQSVSSSTSKKTLMLTTNVNDNLQPTKITNFTFEQIATAYLVGTPVILSVLASRPLKTKSSDEETTEPSSNDSPQSETVNEPDLIPVSNDGSMYYYSMVQLLLTANSTTNGGQIVFGPYIFKASNGNSYPAVDDRTETIA